MPGFVTPTIPDTDKTSKWVPRIGKRSNFLLNSLPSSEFPKKAKQNLTEETYRILSSCHDPKKEGENNSVGLVVGRVQSGKTTSFKTLTMMGMDNGFSLFILLAGRTNNLIEQNKDEFVELKKSLPYEFVVTGADKGPKDWEKIIDSNLRRIKGLGSLKGVPLILVTNKHAGHIKAITKALNKRKASVATVNTLIIDDEADNASLNTSKDKDDDYSATAIYKSIKGLRASLPKHTVVQYTATPQALLLISKKDQYSPQWARVITPGENYVGAQDLFTDNSSFYQQVPSDEVSSSKDIHQLSLPDSFKSALRSYLLASAQRLHTPKYFHKSNSSFMVHPDVFNITHEHWEEIINEEIDIWRSQIEDNLYQFLNENKKEFLIEYKKLQAACKKNNTIISSFETLYNSYIPGIIQELNIIQVNKNNNSINWDLPHNILIGGYMLDRGYVVKGLITTYMPRGKGGGMIDSLQQRGRFYGYKRSHLGFIKTWMTQPTADAYKSYAKHESHLYKTLNDLSTQGKSLREWERIILLDKGLMPCRKNVMGIGLRNNYTWGGGWYYPAYPIRDSRKNKTIFSSLIDFYKNKFQPFYLEGVDSTLWKDASSALEVKGIKLSSLIESIRYYDPGEYDEGKFATAKQILGILADRDFKASIVLTGTKHPDIDRYTVRKRPTLRFPLTGRSMFQGRTEAGSFPGEANLISKEENTVTFHFTQLVIGGDSKPTFILAIKFPKDNYLVETEIV